MPWPWPDSWKSHPLVSWACYPGLASHPTHDRALKYLPKGCSGVLTFGIKGGAEAGRKFMEATRLVALVVHVGDARSCVLHPASTTHRQLSEEQLKSSGVKPVGDKLSTDGFYGNILAVLSGITSAVMVVSFRAQKSGAPAESILIASLVTAILGFPFVLKETWTLTNWTILAYLGIFQIGLAFVFFTKAIKHIPALEANLVSTLEPVLNPLWVFLFLGESMGAYALIGGLVVLGGVILSAVGSARAALE